MKTRVPPNTDLLTVDTLQHGELGPELGDVGLGRDLHHVGLTAVNDQLHSRNLLLLKYDWRLELLVPETGDNNY